MRTGIVQLARELRGVFGRASEMKDDVGAGGVECSRDGSAHATSRAGNERGLALQSVAWIGDMPVGVRTGLSRVGGRCIVWHRGRL